MKLPLILLLTLFATNVCARGLRVGWEKVFIFIAYRFEMLYAKDEDRQIGF